MKTFVSTAAAIAAVAIAGLAVSDGFAAASGGSMPRPSAPRPTPTSPSQTATEDDYSKAEYLIKAERYEEAIPLLKNVVAKNGRDADAWNYLGFCSRKLGKNTEALEYYNKALAIDPKHKGAHEYLGELYIQTKEPAKAQEQLVILQGLCPGGCEEVEDLQQALNDYKAANPGSS
jgi:tetratricopeptide (TPR) repeat protein